MQLITNLLNNKQKVIEREPSELPWQTLYEIVCYNKEKKLSHETWGLLSMVTQTDGYLRIRAANYTWPVGEIKTVSERSLSHEWFRTEGVCSLHRQDPNLQPFTNRRARTHCAIRSLKALDVAWLFRRERLNSTYIFRSSLKYLFIYVLFSICLANLFEK